ncbi:ATP-binding protein [Phormidium sp. CLA17]|uniref:ATP-binding protein n=1 Tax=Leptolyngbya sp. Cla-17 TaxID=2803751 RepID=UPI00193233FD|nr:ATP-binding protein [Leptolyngbya sp. Cla-17]MBM0740405.1 ATP-binding protein [Leptolyngbya sp. Cla-17]
MAEAPTPKIHIERWLQRTIVHVAAYLSVVGGEDILEQYNFLKPYLDPVFESFRVRFPELTALSAIDQKFQAIFERDERASQTETLPLVRLQQAGLSTAHLRVLLLIALVEVDARFGTVYSVLHPFPEEQRLTLGLLDSLMRFNALQHEPPGWQLALDLERRGLLTLHYPEKPRASQALSLPGVIWDALAGEAFSPHLAQTPTARLFYHPYNSLKSFQDLQGLLPGDILERLERLPELVQRNLTQGVVLRGMRGCGRLWALGAVARSLKMDVVHVQRPDAIALPQLCRLVGPLAVLRRALPVIELEPAPGEIVNLPPLAGYDGLLGFLLNREGSLSGLQAEGCITLQISPPDYAARQKQWQLVVDEHVPEDTDIVETVSRNYHLTLGAIEQVGQLAHAYAALNQHDSIQFQDLREASQSLNQQTLENLATRIPTEMTSGSLVVSKTTQQALDNLILRCRYRESLLEHLGDGFMGMSRGVRALFTGTSGTGKTLAARIIAAKLGLDLYRVDLSSVVSKYIGETERNLSRLFARAEEQDIILLLDEGDSLLTARTDVKSSTDRYANLETNYLLQRLEQYEGIILITTNTASRIDSAFQRRIDVLIEFGLPDAGQRQSLWQLHLPAQHQVSQALLHRVSLRCELTGGQIRNGVLHASLLAFQHASPLNDEFLTEGIHREYTKMGAVSPLH